MTDKMDNLFKDQEKIIKTKRRMEKKNIPEAFCIAFSVCKDL